MHPRRLAALNLSAGPVRSCPGSRHILRRVRGGSQRQGNVYRGDDSRIIVRANPSGSTKGRKVTEDFMLTNLFQASWDVIGRTEENLLNEGGI
jgi:hypothetical protein